MKPQSAPKTDRTKGAKKKDREKQDLQTDRQIREQNQHDGSDKKTDRSGKGQKHNGAQKNGKAWER